MADILCVDDDSRWLSLYAMILERTGHKIRTAIDFREALAALYEKPFDILVTDFQIPRGTGEELIEKAKTLRPKILTLMISGAKPEISAADAVIDKPFNNDHFLAMIKLLCNSL